MTKNWGRGGGEWTTTIPADRHPLFLPMGLMKLYDGDRLLAVEPYFGGFPPPQVDFKIPRGVTPTHLVHVCPLGVTTRIFRPLN